MRTRRSKYAAVPCVVDGIRFASQLESRRYQELRLLEKAGQIHNLRLQPRYPLMVAGEVVCTYVADFEYLEGKIPAAPTTEECKGHWTPLAKLKVKLFEALRGYKVTIVTKAGRRAA